VRLVVAPAGVERAMALLGVHRDRLVALPNGVDVELFSPRATDRHAFWRRALVQEPQGWLPDQPPGSARYSETAVAQLAAGTVLLYVGRFTAVKRLDLLIGAFARAQEHLTTPAGLVLVGGHPGEWENEHPAQIAARLGMSNVFLAGWQTQHELPAFFAAADAVVMSSEREQFGQALIEGMACGLPAIATSSLGPAAIIEHGRTGWLTPPDDETALATALTEAVNDAPERQQRGHRARLSVRERFSWPGIATQLMTVLEAATEGTRHAPAIEARASHPRRARQPTATPRTDGRTLAPGDSTQ
jgi:glycosyltransferase involved in cell wall biosynthesis